MNFVSSITADQVFCRGYVKRKEEGLSKANFPTRRVAKHNALLIVLLKKLSIEMKESVDDSLLERHTSYDRKGNAIIDAAKIEKDLSKQNKKFLSFIEQVDLAKKACHHEAKMAVAVERKGTGIIREFEGEDDLDET